MWDTIEIENDSGDLVKSQSPIIVSASRSTDIPSFYSDWFISRLKRGYSAWINPFNGIKYYVSYKNTRLIVFWSKDPKKMIKYLDYLDEMNINYYFQYTLNDYVSEHFEPNVSSLESRIDTFIELSEKIGKSKVVWRFDPLMLTDTLGIDQLLKKVQNIGDQLKNYVEKFVFSYADIKEYNNVQNNLRNGSIKYQEFNERLMIEFAKELQKLNSNWKYKISTCAEKIALGEYGITHNKCIDDDLIIKLFPHDKILMDFLGVRILPPDIFNTVQRIGQQKNLKDKGQRKLCGCILSKDIGEYNTCPHLCEYCYANSSKKSAISNWRQHIINPLSDTITGK